MIQDIVDNWHVYATMPLIAALIGYVTKRAAIEMMYRPLEFVGVRPFLGWQGVMTTNLVQPKEIFARLGSLILGHDLVRDLVDRSSIATLAIRCALRGMTGSRRRRRV